MKKHNRNLYPLIPVLLSVWSAAGQGTFQNLDFEQSIIVSSSPSGGGYNTGTANVPGWTAYGAWGAVNYSGGTTLIYNNQPLDSAGASLEGVDYLTPAIAGNYSVFLEAGTIYYPPAVGASIGQTGQIPLMAKSITYWGALQNGLQVTFEGQELSFIPLSTAANHTVYGADISSYAGQTGELKFNSIWPNGGGVIDNIQISNLPIPEPGVFGLSALGALLLGWCFLRQRSRLQTPVCLVGGLALLLSAGGATGQGTFQNLDFESARIIPLTEGADYPPYSIATTNAVPGWAVFYGTTQQSQITYNDPALGSTFVTLYATNGQNISGNCSLLLQGGLTAAAASISQTALTPVAAESILFKAQYNNGASGVGLLLVSMNGQNIPFSSISTGPNYTLYGGDISAFAGRVAQLTFSALNLSSDNNWNIDDIQFSNLPVPEPGVFGLTALGALLLGWRVLRRARPLGTCRPTGS